MEISNTVTVLTDSAQVIELKFTSTGTDTIIVALSGWYFPVGM